MVKYKLAHKQEVDVYDFFELPTSAGLHVQDARFLLGNTTVDLTGKSVLVDNPDNSKEKDTWVEVDYLRLDGRKFRGWILATALGDKLEDAVSPVSEGLFVAECIRCEVTDKDGGTVGCDYLIAWALIESSLKDFSAHLGDPTALGPFQISTSDWEAYAKVLTVPVGPDGRLLGYDQIDCAAWLAERDARLFGAAMAAGANPLKDYVTSLLNIFHCRVIGVEAAVAVQKAIAATTSGANMKNILSGCGYQQAALAQILKDRKTFLASVPAAPVPAAPAAAAPANNAVPDFRTVGEFVAATSDALEKALKQAFDLIKQYVPEFITQAADKTVADGWMQVADKELADWKAGQFVETAGEGRNRVIQYFTAATNPHAPSEPWCGAFAAWCLKKGGTEQYGVFEPEVASHWTQWGDLELRQRDYGSILRGAIVVLSPQDNTGGSGHVAFFDEKVSDDEIRILGGNQSNKVTTMPASRSEIVAIRWLSTLNTAPQPPAAGQGGQQGGAAGPAGPQAGQPGGNGDRNQIILARTLYGEARDQKQDGLEAVANVVMNRVNAKTWFGKTVEQVCLKNKQFSCWNPGDVNRDKIINLQPGRGDAIFDQCFKIAGDAIAGTLADRTGGATHFHADTMKRFPDWAVTLTQTAHIRAHIFYQ